jgi:hypothetical protein
VIIPVGGSPPPLYVWISAQRAARIRSRCGVTGLLLIGAALVVGVMLVVVGLNLPTAYHPISTIGVVVGALTAVWLLLSGVGLTSARSAVQGEYLDANGARVTRRVLGVQWGGTIFCSSLSCFLQLMTLNNGPRQVPFTAGAAVYLILLVLPVVLTGVAFFVARRLLNPRAVGHATPR